jgi:hypothetical protein
MNTIKCPYCGKPIEIDKVLEEGLRHSIEDDVRNKSKEEQAKFQEKAIAAVREKFEVEMKTRDEELVENRKQNKELREQLTELMKQLREEKTARENTEIVMQKRLLQEEEKIRQKAKDEDAEKHRLDLKERDLQMASMRKTIEELQRKGSIGSQQLQGEVLELDLETTLRDAIPNDVFEPIGKGVLGADIRQIVKTQRGNVCGVILWESKRTKAWGGDWIAKLKEDKLNDKAHVAAIVSETLPEEAKTGMGLKEGIWVCSPKLAVPLALLLHKAIEDTARQKFVSDRQQTSAERIYSAVTSHEFVQRVESMMEIYTQMLTQITTERKAFESSWALREKQVQRLMSGMSRIVAQIQEAAGPTLPHIKSFELEGGA